MCSSEITCRRGLSRCSRIAQSLLARMAKGDGAVVVLHHTDVIVPLRQGGLGLDMEVVGVPCRKTACSGHAYCELVQASAGAQSSTRGVWVWIQELEMVPAGSHMCCDMQWWV